MGNPLGIRHSDYFNDKIEEEKYVEETVLQHYIKNSEYDRMPIENTDKEEKIPRIKTANKLKALIIFIFFWWLIPIELLGNFMSRRKYLFIPTCETDVPAFVLGRAVLDICVFSLCFFMLYCIYGINNIKYIFIGLGIFLAIVFVDYKIAFFDGIFSAIFHPVKTFKWKQYTKSQEFKDDNEKTKKKIEEYEKLFHWGTSNWAKTSKHFTRKYGLEGLIIERVLPVFYDNKDFYITTYKTTSSIGFWYGGINGTRTSFSKKESYSKLGLYKRYGKVFFPLTKECVRFASDDGRWLLGRYETENITFPKYLYLYGYTDNIYRYFKYNSPYGQDQYLGVKDDDLKKEMMIERKILITEHVLDL